MNAGLVLTGGGARAAYQVGVLIAISEILRKAGRPKKNSTWPFPILCGTSAGAVNAAILACNTHDFSRACSLLKAVWTHLSPQQIYRVDPLNTALTGMRWLNAFAFGWLTHHNPQALLDNKPLETQLNYLFSPKKVSAALNSGALQALAVSASSYTSGRHVTFFQAQEAIKPWVRLRRGACAGTIHTKHLLASSAIPFIFPAVALPYAGGYEYFGDGAIHQIAPMSPAIHLGARKILVIGGAPPMQQHIPTSTPSYPSLAQIGGHALTSLFLDSLAHDVDNINRLNDIYKSIPTAQHGDFIQHVDVLTISPSQNLEPIALQHFKTLPRSLRILLRGIGISNHSGATLLSYLLFDSRYTKLLIDMGHADALMMEDEIKKLLL